MPGKVGNEGFTYHITEHGHEGTCREIMNQPNDHDNWYQMLKSEVSFLYSTNLYSIGLIKLVYGVL